MQDEVIAWPTTVRAGGQPQSVPVWFLWDAEGFLIYPQRGRRKLKNIAGNPRVCLNLNSSTTGGDVVRVEGTVEVDEGAPPAGEVDAYVAKYRDAIARIGFDVDGFARAYPVAVRVEPTRWQVW